MKTIIVTGITSKSGKTTLLTKIIENLAAMTDKIGVIKCSIKDDYMKQVVTDDPEIIYKEGTDTARIDKAGSNQTILIKSRRDSFKDALDNAMNILKDVNYLLVEGNSAVRYLSSDLIIYLDNKDLEMKESAEEARKRADIIINTGDLSGRGEVSAIPFRFNQDKISCPRALLTAAIMDRKPILIGKKLNKEKIKLKGCQLGCF